MAVDWQDTGVVLSARRHGEYDIILSVLTERHGRHAGVVKGGSGRRSRGLYQPGNLLHIRWRARLPEHLGTFSCELERTFAADSLGDPLQLTALTAFCAMADGALPEREPHELIFRQALHLLERLGDSCWPSDYVLWELSLLSELGFGLDLGSCAGNGTTEDLVYISPKSGRAVSRSAGAPYHGRLLPLPGFLRKEGVELPSGEDVQAGLTVTGHFLDQFVFRPHQRDLPEARARLISRLFSRS